MNKMITVKTATFQHELIVAKTFLEDNGIKTFLKDEFLVQLHPATTSQGIQLQVLEKDVDRALELLIEGGFVSVEEYKDYSDPLTKVVAKIIGKLTGDK